MPRLLMSESRSPSKLDVNQHPPYIAPYTDTHSSYLKSPIVSLVCGEGDDRQTLAAHQLLLEQSPHLAEKIAQFTDDQAVS